MKTHGTLTATELIESLSRTGLPTLLVEGDDDIRWYRMVEKMLPKGIDIMQTGGRTTMLQIYEKRTQFRVPVVFAADRDLWIFSGVPSECLQMVLTSGFSIENDFLCDSQVDDILTNSERTSLEKCLDSLSIWYAHEVKKYLRGEPYEIRTHPKRLLKKATFELDVSEIYSEGFEHPSESEVNKMRESIRMKLRGKNLLELYALIFSQRKGMSPKYSKESIMELAIKGNSTKLKTQMLENIAIALKLEEERIRKSYQGSGFKSGSQLAVDCRCET